MEIPDLQNWICIEPTNSDLATRVPPGGTPRLYGRQDARRYLLFSC